MHTGLQSNRCYDFNTDRNDVRLRMRNMSAFVMIPLRAASATDNRKTRGRSVLMTYIATESTTQPNCKQYLQTKRRLFVEITCRGHHVQGNSETLFSKAT